MTVNDELSNRDRIEISSLEAPCRVGDSAAERAFPQILLVDLHIVVPLAEAGRRDRIEDTVDYADVIADVRATLESREFVLQEAVAEAIANVAMKDQRVRMVTVAVRKKAFAGVGAVGVSISRTRL